MSAAERRRLDDQVAEMDARSAARIFLAGIDVLERQAEHLEQLRARGRRLLRDGPR